MENLTYRPPRSDEVQRTLKILTMFAKTFEFNRRPNYPHDYLNEYISCENVRQISKPNIINLLKTCAERDVVELVDFLMSCDLALKKYDYIGIMFWSVLHDSPTVFSAILTASSMVSELISPADSFDKLQQFKKYSITTYAIMLGRTRIINIIGPQVADLINKDSSLVYWFILSIYDVSNQMFRLMANRHHTEAYYKSISWIMNYTKNYGEIDFARQISEKLDCYLSDAVVADNVRYVMFADRFRAGVARYTRERVAVMPKFAVTELLSKAADVVADKCIRYLSIRYGINKRAMFDRKIGNSIRSLICDYSTERASIEPGSVDSIFGNSDIFEPLDIYDI